MLFRGLTCVAKGADDKVSDGFGVNAGSEFEVMCFGCLASAIDDRRTTADGALVFDIDHELFASKELGGKEVDHAEDSLKRDSFLAEDLSIGSKQVREHCMQDRADARVFQGQVREDFEVEADAVGHIEW